MNRKRIKLDRGLAADIVIFTIKDAELKVLLIKRGHGEFTGKWALPGGFRQIGVDKDIESVASRVLKSETGTEAPYLEQLYTFSNDSRDPSGWVTSVSYFALMPHFTVNLQPGRGIDAIKWVSVRNNTLNRKLAFDHNQIVDVAIERLRSKLQYTAIAGHLLGSEFTRPQLQSVYETILNCSLDKSHFNRSLVRSNVLESTGKKTSGDGHRPAELFKFKKDADSSFFFPRDLVRSAIKK